MSESRFTLKDKITSCLLIANIGLSGILIAETIDIKSKLKKENNSCVELNKAIIEDIDDIKFKTRDMSQKIIIQEIKIDKLLGTDKDEDNIKQRIRTEFKELKLNERVVDSIYNTIIKN